MFIMEFNSLYGQDLILACLLKEFTFPSAYANGLFVCVDALHPSQRFCVELFSVFTS